ncbi:ROK family protein [Streptomyces sp. NPDC096132]|uniref:ROK family protein n=1 Tax=Streptomyces sp. NPDC096132 TaxID=3366075 RepID=UPI0038251A9B
MIRDVAQEATGLPGIVENDANAAAWGEFVHGAGAGHEDMLRVTAGAGLGGGIISRGRIFRSRFGMAGEIGHYRAVPDGLQCPCGQRGCMEQYASEAAHKRRAREWRPPIRGGPRRCSRWATVPPPASRGSMLPRPP